MAVRVRASRNECQVEVGERSARAQSGERDGLVDEHGVRAGTTPGRVAGIDVHDRALPAEFRGQDGDAHEARLLAERGHGQDRLSAALEPRVARAHDARRAVADGHVESPAKQTRMPPPRWPCGSATPPGSKSTRSQRMSQLAAGSRSMAASSATTSPSGGAPDTPAADGDAVRTRSKRSRSAPVAPAWTRTSPAPRHAWFVATRVAASLASIASSPATT